jgi:hypothetical protein
MARKSSPLIDGTLSELRVGDEDCREGQYSTKCPGDLGARPFVVRLKDIRDLGQDEVG